GIASAIAHGFGQYILGTDMSFVIDQAPGAIKRCRAVIILVPPDDIAGGIAYGAINALDRRIRLLARLAGRIHQRRPVMPRLAAEELAPGILPFLEKSPHIDDQVLDQWHVPQRFQSNDVVFGDILDVAATGPARLAVYRHR